MAKGTCIVGVSSIFKEVCRSCRMVQEPWFLPAALSSSQTMIPHRHGSNRSSVAMTNRKVYPRLYPCLLVNPDGSTIRIKYSEPRKILKFPLDLNTLTAEQKKARLVKFQPKKKLISDDDIEDDFSVDDYSHLWKKK